MERKQEFSPVVEDIRVNTGIILKLDNILLLIRVWYFPKVPACLYLEFTSRFRARLDCWSCIGQLNNSEARQENRYEAT